MKTVRACLLAAMLCAAWACGRGSPAPGQTASSTESAQQLGFSDAANANVALASSDRWVVAAWTATRRSQTDVYAATSQDGGAQFGPPVQVNDVDGEAHVYGEDPPRVALSPQEARSEGLPVIIVTWPSDRTKRLGLRSARSLDGGKTFTPSISIGDESIIGERGFQSVTVGHDHVVRAVWLDQRRDPGTPHHANAGDDWDPMHLLYATADRDGRWNPESRLASNVCGCCKTAVATGADGSIYVAWRHIYPGNLRDISFAASRDGETFSAPIRISEDHWALNGCPDDGPTMAVDRSGTVHIVWPTLVAGPEPAIRLFHASTRDGVTFTRRQMIETLGTSKPSHPQMGLDRCGALVLVWDEAQGPTRRIAMRRLTPLASGDVQVGALEMLSNGERGAVYPVVASSSTGIVAAWTEVNSMDDQSRIAVRGLPRESDCQAR